MVSNIRDYLENLGVGVGIDRATSARGANGVTVLRTPEGKLLAQVEEPELADFLCVAPPDGSHRCAVVSRRWSKAHTTCGSTADA